MKRYDMVADKGRGNVLFVKARECDTGKYIEYKDHETAIKKMRDLMVEMADYLNRNNQNYIGSGSIFNQQMNEIINTHSGDK
jgi:hypothetical protein